MKVVIILLAFLTPLLTSTRALTCISCSGSTPPGDRVDPCEIVKFRKDRIPYEGVSETVCPPNPIDPKDTYCMTLFRRSHGLQKRGCVQLSDVIKNLTTIKKKPGCQYYRNYELQYELDICLCNDKDNCNDLVDLPSSDNDNGNTNNNNYKIVGMSVATLLGGVLALSLMKYL